MHLKNYSPRNFDRGAPFWKEALWTFVKCLFFMSPWPLPSAVRAALLRIFGAQVGERAVIRARVNVTFPWRLTLGDDVWLGEEVLLLTLAPIVIESDVCISQRAFLCTGSHDHRAEDFGLIVKPITVRRGSWIAAQAFVAPGVEIGEGSVVSAGSVCLENAPPGMVVRGNPAVAVGKSGARNPSAETNPDAK